MTSLNLTPAAAGDETPRSLRLPLLATAAGTVVYAALIRLASPAVLVGLQFAVMLLVNGFAIRSMLARAAAAPLERRGWSGFALGLSIVVIANGVMMVGALAHDVARNRRAGRDPPDGLGRSRAGARAAHPSMEVVTTPRPRRSTCSAR